MDFFSNPKKHAHPKAKRLMNEDFFWSSMDEAGPFGSDSGAEAAEGFNQWRKRNKSESPVKFLYDLLPSWGFALFDWNELDPVKINDYIRTKADVGDLDQHIARLKETIQNSPSFSGNDLTDEALKDIVLKSAEGMGNIYLLQMDNAIIGTGFAQFVLEGKIDGDLHYLTLTALKRQMLPVIMDTYNKDFREIRKQTLVKLANVIENSKL